MNQAGTTIRSDDESGVWTIETAHLSIVLRRSESGEVVLGSLRTGGREWSASEFPLVAMDGSDGPSIALQEPRAESDPDGRSLRLHGTLAPLGLTLYISFAVYDGHSVVTTDIRLLNETADAIEIGNLSTFRLRTAASADGHLHILAGGRWNEATPPRGYRLETYDLNELRHLPHVAAATDGRSSGEYVPWLALTGPAEGLFAALAWSGRWELGAQRDVDTVTLSLGIAGFTHSIAPGEEISLPGLILCGFNGDLDDGANQWRDWVANHWAPPAPENWPWAQYNHWYAYHGDIDADRLHREAVHAAAVGCEVFVIDDGWFLGRRPDSYHEGWGNWHEDPDRFPGGLHAFGDNIRRLGMKFGLWVEPERADPDGELVRSQPDFVATRDGASITRLPDGTGGVHLCLGNPDVQRWMADDIMRVVKEYGVDWLKWDYNLGYGMGCDNETHGHQTGDGHHAHTLGLYTVLENIRAGCPELVVENCASGGHRVDMGILRHSHTNWLSDYTARASSCRQHSQGAGLMLPLAQLNTWALDDRNTSEFRSRMGGAFGVSSYMEEWSDPEREDLRNSITDYTRLRPLLSGSRYLLSGPLHQDWDVWQFVDQTQDSFAILAFREQSQIEEVRVRLRDLAADHTYRLQWSDEGTSVDIDGASLLSDGLAICVGAGGSEIIWGTMTSN